MSENRFKIVFDGALQPGVDATTAKLNLADLFKSDVAAIERLFSGRAVALKRDLSHADAQTYLQALTKTGIDARIETEPSIELNLSDVHEHAPANNQPRTADPDSPYAPPRASVGEALPEFFCTQGIQFRWPHRSLALSGLDDGSYAGDAWRWLRAGYFSASRSSARTRLLA